MLKFLVIFFSVIYIGGMVIRWFMRKWISNLSQQNKAQQEPPRKEGEVTINYSDESKKSRNDGDGDYIDYEEVK